MKAITTAMNVKQEQFVSFGQWVHKIGQNLKSVDQEGTYVVKNGLTINPQTFDAAKEAICRNGILDFLVFITLLSQA